MNDVLREMLERFVFISIDDILILSPDLATHIGHVKQVLRALLKAGLFVRLRNAFFTPPLFLFWVSDGSE